MVALFIIDKKTAQAKGIVQWNAFEIITSALNYTAYYLEFVLGIYYVVCKIVILIFLWYMLLFTIFFYQNSMLPIKEEPCYFFFISVIKLVFIFTFLPFVAWPKDLQTKYLLNRWLYMRGMCVQKKNGCLF